MLAALQAGTMRGFIPVSVWAEVPRVLVDRHRESHGGFDLQEAEALWWSKYIPVLHVVDTGGLPDTTLAIALAEMDPTDVPTVLLAEVLAPVVVFATDRDLRRIDLAHEDWGRTRAALGKVGPVEEMSQAAVVSGYAVTAGTFLGIKRLVMWAHDHPRAAAFAGVAIVWAVARWEPHTKARSLAADLGPELRKAIGDGLQAHTAGEQTWAGAERGQAGASMLHRVARTLAQAPKPMTRTEILDRLGPVEGPGHRALMAGLARMLHGYPMFVEVAAGRWQVGRAGVGF